VAPVEFLTEVLFIELRIGYTKLRIGIAYPINDWDPKGAMDVPTAVRTFESASSQVEADSY
jgi:hypothetical protein